MTIGSGIGTFLCDNNLALARMLNSSVDVKIVLLSLVFRDFLTSLVGYPCTLGPVGPSMARFLAGWPQAQHRAQHILFSHLHRLDSLMGR